MKITTTAVLLIKGRGDADKQQHPEEAKPKVFLHLFGEEITDVIENSCSPEAFTQYEHSRNGDCSRIAESRQAFSRGQDAGYEQETHNNNNRRNVERNEF
ncbi:hypothetical protein NC796_10730 [Aliifodinibius sp. S!AR15-10]|nr:hypothetical protein [Aliifodinibius sp. S!AR15-10]MDR8391618.1 hypothetical protein [Aliifodinibius sp. S!AR15-10]